MLDIVPLIDGNFDLLQNGDISQSSVLNGFGHGLDNQLGQFAAHDLMLSGATVDQSLGLDIEPFFLDEKTIAPEQMIKLAQVGDHDPITGFNVNPDLINSLGVVATGGDELTGLNNSIGVTQKYSSNGATHPLDPLTEAEIEAAVSVILQEQDLKDSARFANIVLREPDKNEVLAFKPGDPFTREAFLTVIELAENRVYEAIIDLNTLELMSWTEIPGVQPAILDSEFELLTEVVKADSRWQEAMRDRGITDFDNVVIDGWAPGILSAEEEESGARLIRGLSYLQGDDNNFYARPIEGVLVTVDLNQGEVVGFVDTGIVTIPDVNAGLDEASIGELREPPKPLVIQQPEGTSFEIDGNEISWQNWLFRYSIQPREGLVLYQVSYDDQGEQRPILYRASLSELAVPYADTSENWQFRNALDVGEYNLGRLSNTLELGREVPENGVLLDAVFSDEFGEPYATPQVVGIYERDSGLLWHHYDYVTGETESRRGRELVLTSIMTVGNYDYGIDWIFHQDGTLEVEAQLTDILQFKGTDATKEDELSESDNTGELLAPNILAPNHQHFFNFRLDMDVDGAANSVYEQTIEPLPVSEDNPEGNAFAANKTLLLTEAQVTQDDPSHPHSDHHSEWSIVNAVEKNALGGDIGYTLHPGENSAPFAAPDSEVRQLAGFINHPVWFTEYKPGELYASGDYPNQGTANQGLPEYVADDESLVGKDVVLWYTMGVSHIPRPEDFPVLPVERAGFKLKPTGFFTRNPALNVPSPPTEQ